MGIFSQVTSYVRRKLRDFRDIFRRIAFDIEEIMDETADEVGKRAVRIARRLARERMPSGGGSFLPTIQYEVERNGDETVVRVYSDHPYASHIELGTRPHEIPSGRARPMRIREKFEREEGSSGVVPFGTRYDDVDIVRSRVMHPGSRAFNIFRDMLEEMKDETVRIVIDELEREGY
jgi:hypothetical protein